MSPAALEITGLHVGYGPGAPALRGVDLRVEPGECVALVGESGCGKSTLVRAVLGLLPRSATATGRIVVGGQDVLGAPAAELRRLRGRTVGYVGQDPYASFDPLRTVADHVAEAWAVHGERPPAGAVAARLAALGIPDGRADDHPHQWSGGMLQRAAIAAATVHSPAVTLADEPTSALDADLGHDVLRVLRATSAALLLVSHDLRLVAEHADRIAVVRGGTIVEIGRPAHLLARPAHGYTRRLLAACPAPLPEGPATDDHAEPALPGPPAVASVRGVTRRYTRGHRGGAGAGGTGTGVTAVGVTAVDGVDLDVAPGEILGLVGRSGSGKSTLLRLLAGMERPDAGSVRFSGRDVWSGRRGARVPRPGFVMPVFQDPVAGLDRRWPLWRTVTEPLVLAGHRLDRAARRSRAREALAELGLDDVDPDVLPGQLSVGQCQRVAIVRAAVAGPELIVADEPTAGLDVTTAAAVGDLLRRIAGAGTALVVVSHDEPRLAGYADRIVRMAEGRIIGSRRTVALPPGSPAIGSPATGFLPTRPLPDETEAG